MTKKKSFLGKGKDIFLRKTTRLFLIIVVSVGFFIYTKNYKPSKTSPTAQPKNDSGATWGINKTQLRFFDSKDYFFSEVKYPNELLSYNNSSLKSLTCTPLYSGWDGEYSYNDDYTNSHPLQDYKVIQYIDLISKKHNGEEVNEIIACMPGDSSDSVLFYSVGTCGGGCSGFPHIAIYDGTNLEELNANIEIGSAYFGCRQPLLTTKNNYMYFQCGGGDGGGGMSAIYKLSLESKKITKIIQCAIGYDDSTQDRYTTCE